MMLLRVIEVQKQISKTYFGQILYLAQIPKNPQKLRKISTCNFGVKIQIFQISVFMKTQFQRRILDK